MDAKYAELSKQYGLVQELLRQQLPPLRLRHDLKLVAAAQAAVDPPNAMTSCGQPARVAINEKVGREGPCRAFPFLGIPGNPASGFQEAKGGGQYLSAARSLCRLYGPHQG